MCDYLITSLPNYLTVCYACLLVEDASLESGSVEQRIA